MQAIEIPLTPNNQTFQITLRGRDYTLTVLWRDVAGWTMDVMDNIGSPLLLGVSLVPGVNLMAQYPELGFNGALVVVCDDGAPEYPTSTNLGTYSHLIFLQE